MQPPADDGFWTRWPVTIYPDPEEPADLPYVVPPYSGEATQPGVDLRAARKDSPRNDQQKVDRLTALV